jgi:MYXO-CTERM domain-containing protein
MRTPLLAAAVAAATILMSTETAGAYCRTTTATGSLPPNTGACAAGGVPTYWLNRCVGYSVSRLPSRYATVDETEALAAAAFSTWTNADCSGARPTIDAVDLGPVDCSEIGFDPHGSNQNVIVFRDAAWPYPDGAQTLAHTTVTFDAETGEILDADIEINTHDHRIVAHPSAPGEFDLGQVLLHETGHFLGIAHTPVSAATMFYRYNPSHRSELADDDIAAICDVYPASSVRDPSGADGGALLAPSCDPAPHGGLGDQCGPASIEAWATAAPNAGAVRESNGGCNVTPPRAPSLAAGLLVLALGALRRRRKLTG